MGMLNALIDAPRDAAPVELRERLDHLRAENARLRAENRDLRAAVDAHVRRASCPGLFGPLEMTAGTSVGPRRHREQ